MGTFVVVIHWFNPLSYILLRQINTISELSCDETVVLTLKNEEIKQAIEKLEKEFDGNGRVLIRPSGTEPLVRVMIEGQDKEYIKTKAESLAKLIEKKLN